MIKATERNDALRRVLAAEIQASVMDRKDGRVILTVDDARSILQEMQNHDRRTVVGQMEARMVERLNRKLMLVCFPATMIFGGLAYLLLDAVVGLF